MKCPPSARVIISLLERHTRACSYLRDAGLEHARVGVREL